MKKRSLFLAVAAGFLLLGTGAPKAQAASLASLLGTVVDYDGFSFHFTSWTPTGGAPSATDVQVTFVSTVIGGVTEAGFTLSGSFGAGAGTTSDGDLVFSVDGTNLNDARLQGNPALNANNVGGLASVTESIYAGGSIFGSQLASLYIQNSPPGPLQDSASFSGGSLITIDKDIEAIGGTTGASLSTVSQLFSQGVPEPSSWALLGIGMTGFLAFRRFFKKTPVA
jgi:PEP-CTERM motif-containing protein